MDNENTDKIWEHLNAIHTIANTSRVEGYSDPDGSQRLQSLFPHIHQIRITLGTNLVGEIDEQSQYYKAQIIHACLEVFQYDFELIDTYKDLCRNLSKDRALDIEQRKTYSLLFHILSACKDILIRREVNRKRLGIDTEQ